MSKETNKTFIIAEKLSKYKMARRDGNCCVNYSEQSRATWLQLAENFTLGFF